MILPILCISPVHGLRQCHSFLTPFFLRVENGITGSTITDRKLSGSERGWSIAIGSIETLLTAVPVGKAVTASGKAVGSKIGLAAMNGPAKRLLATDLLGGLGERAVQRLATSRVGQAYIRAYAKVYNSRFNPALFGTTKNPISTAVPVPTLQRGVGAAHPDEFLAISSRISRHSGLVKHAEAAGRSTQTSLDRLTSELARGNFNPGIGSKHLFGEVFEAKPETALAYTLQKFQGA